MSKEFDYDVDELDGDLLSQLAITGGKIIPEKHEKKHLPSIVPADSDVLSTAIIDQLQELANESLGVVKSMSPSIPYEEDGDKVDAYSNVVAATVKALSELNKLQINRTKIQSLEKIKAAEIESRNQIANQTNATALMIGREDLIRDVLKGVFVDGEIRKDITVVDTEVIEEDD